MKRSDFLVLAVIGVLAIALAAASTPQVTEQDDDPTDPWQDQDGEVLAGQGAASILATIGFYGPNGEPIKVDDSWATLSTMQSWKMSPTGGTKEKPIALTEYRKTHTVASYSCQIHKITVEGRNIIPSSIYGDWKVRFVEADGNKITVGDTARTFKASDFKTVGNAEKFTLTWYPTDKGIFTIPLQEFGDNKGLNWDKEGFMWTFQIEADFKGTSLAGDRIKASPFGKKYGIRTSPVWPEEPEYGTPSLVATVETCGQGEVCDPGTGDTYVNPSEDLLYSYETCDPSQGYPCPADSLGASVLPIGSSDLRELLLVAVFLTIGLFVWNTKIRKR